MTALNLHFIAQISVERLLNCLAEGIAIALFAWVLLRLIGRRNSGTRFAVWFCALVAIAVAPFLETSSTGASAIIPPAAAAITMPRSWSLYLFGAWAAIALVGLARVLAGLWHLRTLRKSCTPVDSHNLDPLVLRTLDEFRLARRVELYASDALRVPTAIGFLKAAVVLPSWALQDLSPTELNAVVLHELAHLRRWDDWTNLAQKVMRALFFFHPAVWWVESHLALEREMACDDMVLAQIDNPRAYAQCLVWLAEKNLLQRGVALAQAVVGRVQQTSQRVLQILDAGRPNAVRVWKPAPWVVAAFSVACLASAAHAPRLVAFGDSNATARAALNAHASFAADPQPPYVPQVAPASFIEHDHNEFAHSETQTRKVSTSGRARGRAYGSAARVNLASRKTQDTSSASTQGAPVERSKSPTPAQQRASVASLVRTSATESSDVTMTQQAVFVFMQDQPFGDSGLVVWRVTIWRVTVVPQAPRQVTPEVSSKST
jgi:beta-lactamase regulating signal transducer with metallopeptidase domain